jgi:hypothetical protein
MNATPTFRELTHAMRPQDLHGDGIRVVSHHFLVLLPPWKGALGESTHYEGSCSNCGRYSNSCCAGSGSVTGTLTDYATTAGTAARV